MHGGPGYYDLPVFGIEYQLSLASSRDSDVFWDPKTSQVPLLPSLTRLLSSDEMSTVLGDSLGMILLRRRITRTKQTRITKQLEQVPFNLWQLQPQNRRSVPYLG